MDGCREEEPERKERRERGKLAGRRAGRQASQMSKEQCKGSQSKTKHCIGVLLALRACATEGGEGHLHSGLSVSSAVPVGLENTPAASALFL